MMMNREACCGTTGCAHSQLVENWAESGVFTLDQVREARLLHKPTGPLSLLLSQPAMLSTLHA